MGIRKALWRLRYRFSRDSLHARWKAALPEEIEYWWEYIASGGRQWPEEFRERIAPDTPLQDELRELLGSRPGSVVEILDVGSGPLTYIGKAWEEREVRITAVDPLADDYERLLNEFELNPSIRPQPVEAERLVDHFGCDRFDLVFARNSIDHCHDAMSAIRQMVQVVKPGQSVLLRHYVDEAEYNHYRELHQWNFRLQDGKLVVANYWKSYSVDDALRDVARVEARVDAHGEAQRDQWLVATLTKLSG